MNSIQLPNIGVMLMATVMAGSLGLLFVVWWANRKGPEEAKAAAEKDKKGRGAEKDKSKGKSASKSAEEVKSQSVEAAKSQDQASPTPPRGLLRKIAHAIGQMLGAMLAIGLAAIGGLVRGAGAVFKNQEEPAAESTIHRDMKSRPVKNVTPMPENDVLLPEIPKLNQTKQHQIGR